MKLYKQLIEEISYKLGIQVQESLLSETMSKAERIRAKIRFARTEAKRKRKTEIALKTHSSTSTINKRARRLAISILKRRLAKKPLDRLSVSEKERIENILSKRKSLIDRTAIKMIPKVKKIESERLSHIT